MTSGEKASIEEYLNKGIKDVIDEFPEVENILSEYDIGCVACSVGTCLLKDIVEIHNLPNEDEARLMGQIAKVIFPDEDVKLPKLDRAPLTQSEEITYSPPIKRLVDEHTLIKRLISLIPKVVANINLESADGRQLMIDCVDFIRSYADRFHHAKEEDILFGYFDPELDIITAMLEEHETGRAHVRAIVEAVEKGDAKSACEHLNAYRELLTEHIKKEDEILYLWMDRGFTDAQVGELFSRFNQADDKYPGASEKYEAFINKIDDKFKQNEV